MRQLSRFIIIAAAATAVSCNGGEPTPAGKPAPAAKPRPAPNAEPAQQAPPKDPVPPPPEAKVDPPAEPESKPDPPPPPKKAKGRLERIDGYLVLHVSGTPEEMGEQHGRLLRAQIQKACKALIREGYPGDWHKRLIAGTQGMEKHQPDEFRRELKALAKAAGIDYWDCVAMQLFGDVDRGQFYRWGDDDEDDKDAPEIKCTSFAVLGKATKTGELIAGRNLDFYDAGIGKYGAILMHARPDKGHAFLTVTWCGIINGWTLMNEKGIVTSNNTAYGNESLQGISTCFMLRKVAQYAATVREGIAIVRKGPRACGTNMLIAGGKPPAAVMVEFDHKGVAVRQAKNGYVIAANSFLSLNNPGARFEYDGFLSRYGTLEKLIKKHYGKIDRTMNFAGAEGVPMFCNLHSALLFPRDLTIRVSMGLTPAYKQRYRGFRMTPDGIVAEAKTPPGK